MMIFYIVGVCLWHRARNQCRRKTARSKLGNQKDGQGLLSVPRETHEPGAVH